MSKEERLIYDAIIYGLGIALSKYENVSREAIAREVGKNIRRYLEEKGVEIEAGKNPEETRRKVLEAFVKLGFVDDFSVVKD
ncbi:MAG: hypothetical protein ACE5K4_00625, partial [Candidatus Hydrothermarchaeota archaeon]